MTRVAVIGVGRMGQRHIQAVRWAGFELAGIHDINPDTADTAREAQGLDPLLIRTSVDDLLNDRTPDAVVIATTADSHADLVCRAAEAGVRFVLVEKPMATSLAECDRMMNTCARHGAALSVNHQMRFMDQYGIPRKLMAGEALGGLKGMTVVGGNFGFAMNALHYFEAFRFVAGEPIEEVTAWFSTEAVPNPRGPQFEDRAGAIRAVTGSGKRLYMDVSADQGHGVYVTYAGRNGLVTVDELAGSARVIAREPQYRDLPTTRYGMPAVHDELTIEPAEVVASSGAVLEALIHGGDVVTGEDGRKAVEVLVAAYQSAEQGNIPVRVDGGLDRDRQFPWA